MPNVKMNLPPRLRHGERHQRQTVVAGQRRAAAPLAPAELHPPDAAGARPQKLPVALGQFSEQHGKPVQIVNRLGRWRRPAFLPGSFDNEPALADHLGPGASCSRRLGCRSGWKALQRIDRTFKPRGKQLQHLPVY